MEYGYKMEAHHKNSHKQKNYSTPIHHQGHRTGSEVCCVHARGVDALPNYHQPQRTTQHGHINTTPSKGLIECEAKNPEINPFDKVFLGVWWEEGVREGGEGVLGEKFYGRVGNLTKLLHTTNVKNIKKNLFSLHFALWKQVT